MLIYILLVVALVSCNVISYTKGVETIMESFEHELKECKDLNITLNVYESLIGIQIEIETRLSLLENLMSPFLSDSSNGFQNLSNNFPKLKDGKTVDIRYLLKGEQGMRGFDGRKGDTGAQGLKGEMGITVVGGKGEPGMKGDQGIPGLPGVTGLPGMKVFKWSSFQVFKGEPGPRGSPGFGGSLGISEWNSGTRESTWDGKYHSNDPGPPFGGEE